MPRHVWTESDALTPDRASRTSHVTFRSLRTPNEISYSMYH